MIYAAISAGFYDNRLRCFSDNNLFVCTLKTHNLYAQRTVEGNNLMERETLNKTSVQRAR